MAEHDYERFVRERREQIMERVIAACERAGRSVDEVCVEAISKTVGTGEVLAAAKAGYEAFGENRPQELVRKTEAIADMPGAPNLRFEMVGNLQTNKINQLLGRAVLIHSLSSMHLGEAISKRAEAKGIKAPVLVEVNVSQESSKSGFGAEELLRDMDELMALPGLELRGLMTMAPAHDPQRARASFAGLRELAEQLRREREADEEREQHGQPHHQDQPRAQPQP